MHTNDVIDRITDFLRTGVTEEVLKAEAFSQPWSTPHGARALAKAHFDAFSDHLASIAHAVKQRTGRSATVYTDVKSMASIHDKLSRWHQEAMKNGTTPRTIGTMGDVLRGTILFHGQDEIDHAHHLLYPLGKKVEIKRHGEDPMFGYHGSSHYDLATHGNITAETQVMTHRMWEGKHILHSTYERYRNPELRAQADPGELERHLRASRVGYRAVNLGQDHAKNLAFKQLPPPLPKDPNKPARDPADSRVIHI